jgi:lycopene cyclase CruA
MNEILYVEIPTPDIAAVRHWLHQVYTPSWGEKISTPDGFRLRAPQPADTAPSAEKGLPTELSGFVWSAMRTTYLKVFRWGDRPFPQESYLLQQLVAALREAFPHYYPQLPTLDLAQQSIFDALAPHYPLTAHYFRRIPNGEADLTRVYWWEQRWRNGAQQRRSPQPVVFPVPEAEHNSPPSYDLLYIGGALGVIHAAVMARLGYRVLLVERLPFGRMNREWNISRMEFQSLIDLGLFTPEEFETLIAAEYEDGLHKFFDGNNPPQCRSPVLHTPTVLNVAIDAEKLLRLCGDKLRAAGGTIWDETEFERVEVSPSGVTLQAVHLPSQAPRTVTARLLVDAMGTASPIAGQLNGGHAFDSVCPTVGAVIADGFEPGVWDSRFGDVLFTHGDISRGRQLIWELFPAQGKELTFYLFHYHQVNAENPGSLLEMYEDFFTVLPEYRRCNLDQLTWKKATFGYIPGYFSVRGSDRTIAVDRILAIGDAASLQSPLVFTGFGALVRNLSRLTDLLDTALRHDLLRASHLNQIRAFQSNIAVTWLFSKGMMVPTGKHVAPQRVNAMLNTFFGILGTESTDIADRFIKDRTGWVPFNRMAVKAALQNPKLLLWIWELAGSKDILRWLGTYLSFSLTALMSWALQWLPGVVRSLQTTLEPRFPALWLGLLARSYAITYTMGKPQPIHASLARRLQGGQSPVRSPARSTPQAPSAQSNIGNKI